MVKRSQNPDTDSHTTSTNSGGGILDAFLTRAEAADALHKDKRTLERWERMRTGPPVTRIGRTPYYSIEALREWVASCERKAAAAQQKR